MVRSQRRKRIKNRLDGATLATIMGARAYSWTNPQTPLLTDMPSGTLTNQTRNRTT
ncbi:hypothetical protein BCR44DRAFT_1429791 [Catenaria anguillulae PL171]|uniref:Uncharacterized protein n=1 Tax=Catenaria anguillulae PL171 TaxID=765915 RepID=A0A1Y2HSY1_9FUNG|nr:hypothetical protein BCR44DRAFT_1429791 [Catenaria anguillulae PL171]